MESCTVNKLNIVSIDEWKREWDIFFNEYLNGGDYYSTIYVCVYILFVFN